VPKAQKNKATKEEGEKIITRKRRREDGEGGTLQANKVFYVERKKFLRKDELRDLITNRLGCEKKNLLSSGIKNDTVVRKQEALLQKTLGKKNPEKKRKV